MQPASAAPGREDPVVQLCAFRAGPEEYLVDIMRVREIVSPMPVTAVPGAPPFVAGVVDLRGQVVPVVDLRRRLGLDPAPLTRRSRLLVVNAGAGRLALLVDTVSEVVRVPRSALRPAPPLSAEGRSRLFLGVCSAEGEKTRRSRPGGRRGAAASERGWPARLRLLLNVKALLDPATAEELAALRGMVGRGGEP